VYGMTSRDRVNLVFKHEEPDKVPFFEQEVASNVASELLGRYAYTGGGGVGWRDVAELVYQGKRDFLVDRLCADVVELHVKLNLDIVRPPMVPARDATGPKRKLDDYTYYYEDDWGFWSVSRYDPGSRMFMRVDSRLRREGISSVDRFVQCFLDEPVEVDESEFEAFDYIVERLGSERFIAGGGGIAVPVEAPWMQALFQKPDVVEKYLDHALERTLRVVELMKAHGADFILGGGDLADNHGPMYSPRLFRRLILPRLKKLTSFCHSLGLPYVFRTDGNTWPISQELFMESGVDGYGEIDAQAGMRIGDLKRRLPKLVLWGNVDCAKTLVYGTGDDVARETLRCLEEGAPGSGYILGSSNTIHPNVPTGNLLAMIKTAHKYASYPVKAPWRT